MTDPIERESVIQEVSDAVFSQRRWFISPYRDPNNILTKADWDDERVALIRFVVDRVLTDSGRIVRHRRGVPSGLAGTERDGDG